MNRIYRLVWSKIRNSWVVTSEIAKGYCRGNRKSNRNVSVILASIILFGCMSAPFTTSAVDLTPEEQKIYDKIVDEISSKSGFTVVGNRRNGTGTVLTSPVSGGKLHLSGDRYIKVEIKDIPKGKGVKVHSTFDVDEFIKKLNELPNGPKIPGTPPITNILAKFSVSGEDKAASMQQLQLVGNNIPNIQYLGETGKINVTVEKDGTDAKITVTTDKDLGKNLDISGNTSIIDLKNKMKVGGSSVHHLSIRGKQGDAEDNNFNNQGAQADYAIALGVETESHKEGGTAIGHDAFVDVEGGIALGEKSRADRGKGVSGYDVVTEQSHTDDTKGIWKSTAGELSIGHSEDAVTRQITGVSAGSKDTDAVNVAQLKSAYNNSVRKDGNNLTEADKSAWQKALGIVNANGNNAFMSSWKFQTGKKEYTVSDNQVMTFSAGNGLTVSGSKKGITYGIDVNKFVEELNKIPEGPKDVGAPPITNISTNFSVSGEDKATTTQKLQMGGNKTPNIQYLGETGKINVTVEKDGTDAKVTVTTDKDLGKNLDISGNTAITGLTNRVSANESAIEKANNDLKDYKTTNDLAVQKAQSDATKANSDLAAYKQTNDKAVQQAQSDATKANNELADYKKTNDQAVAEAKQAGTKASEELNEYKKTNDKAVQQAQSDATKASEELKAYKTTNDLAVQKAQEDAEKANNDLAAYKQTNDQAVAAAKQAGTDASNALNAYKQTNDQAVAAAKEVGTKASEELKAYKTTNDLAVQKAQEDAEKANNDLADYKAKNDKAVAAAKEVGTKASEELKAYKITNDLAVQKAQSDATKANSDLTAYKQTNNQTLAEVKTKLNDKADLNLGNLTNIGKTVIQNEAKAEIDKTITEDYVTEKVKKGKIISDALTVGGTGHIIGDDLILELKDKSISKEKLNEVLQKEIDDKADKSVVTTQIGKLMTEVKKNMNVAAGNRISVTQNVNETGGTTFTVSAADMHVKSGTITYDSTTDNGNMTLTHQDGTTATVNGLKNTYTKNGYYDNNHKTLTFTRNDGQTYNVDMSGLLVGITSGWNQLGTKINRVGAGAAALAGLHPLEYDPEDKWNIAVGYGNYMGANSLALGAFYQPDEHTMISLGGSFGDGQNMVNVGLSMKVGKGISAGTSKIAMSREIVSLKETVVKQAQQIQEIRKSNDEALKEKEVEINELKKKDAQREEQIRKLTAIVLALQQK